MKFDSYIPVAVVKEQRNPTSSANLVFWNGTDKITIILTR